MSRKCNNLCIVSWSMCELKHEKWVLKFLCYNYMQVFMLIVKYCIIHSMMTCYNSASWHKDSLRYYQTSACWQMSSAQLIIWHCTSKNDTKLQSMVETGSEAALRLSATVFWFPSIWVIMIYYLQTRFHRFTASWLIHSIELAEAFHYFCVGA